MTFCFLATIMKVRVRYTGLLAYQNNFHITILGVEATEKELNGVYTEQILHIL